MVKTPIPVWLDCDPGHDDAFAMLLAAYEPAIQLLGISTVFGNSSLPHTTRNAASLLTAMGKEDDVALYVGAASSLSRPPVHAGSDIHGESGLDGTDLLPAPLREPNTAVPAVDAMAKALWAQPAGTAWLVATGAMTNAAQLLMAHPGLADHLAGFSLMGGAIGDGFSDAVTGSVDGKPRIGNTTPFAEFNILSDPEAAAVLFHNPRLARKTTLIPLDLTHQVLATPAVQSLLLYGPGGAASSASGPVAGKTVLRTMLVQLLTFFADTYKNVFGIAEGPPLHDPLAVAAVLTGTSAEIPFYDYKPGAAAGTHERFDVRVVTDGTLEEALAGKAETGRTVATLLAPGAEGVRIPRGLDIAHFWRVIEECCARADAANAKKGRA